jgi:hypothetical protein
MSLSGTVIRRLADLERLMPQEQEPWRQVIVHEGEDADARIAEFIARGEAKEGDRFIFRQIVNPKLEEGVSR